ncbi:flagellar FliJ family protein [Vibrio lentus]|nr:flagellar FliJ family protein [Vibrio lentus]
MDGTMQKRNLTEWLMEKRQAREAKVQDQREQKQMDEFSTLMHGRKKMDPVTNDAGIVRQIVKSKLIGTNFAPFYIKTACWR